MKSILLYAFFIFTSTCAFSPRAHFSKKVQCSGTEPRSLSSECSPTRSLSFECSPTYFLEQSYQRISTSMAMAENSDDLEFDWKTTAKEVFKGDDRPIILFDGVCNLCNGGVNFALDHDSVGKFRFTSLQSRAGRALLMRSGKKPDDISSIVLVTPKTAYFKSDAVLRIARGLDGKLLTFAGTLGPIVPKIFRNTVYDFVANNRYRFGEVDQCRLDFDNEFGGRFVPDDL